MNKTGSLKAIFIPAALTAGFIYLDWGVDYANVIAVLSVILGLVHQVIDSLFIGVIMEERTEITRRLWARMQADEELWSLRANIWIGMVFAVISIFFPGAEPLTMFLSLCILVGLWRYLGHKGTYDLHLLGVRDFTGEDDE